MSRRSPLFRLCGAQRSGAARPYAVGRRCRMVRPWSRGHCRDRHRVVRRARGACRAGIVCP